MITRNENTFFLSTLSSTLLLRINEVGKPVTEYYGERIEHFTPEAAFTKAEMTMGPSVVYDKEKSESICLQDIPSDISTPLKGDHHAPSMLLRNEVGVVFDFVFVSAEIKEPSPMEGYPLPRGGNEELVLYMEDQKMGAKGELHYVVYEDGDVIGRYVKLINESSQTVILGIL